MDIRTLKPDELDKWLDYCPYVFGNGVIDPDYRYYFEKHFKNDPQATYDGIFVAVENNENNGNEKIVSTVRVFIRRIFVCGKSITMGGIGEDCTDPEYRRQGLSFSLLKKAIEFMKKLNINISVLFTGNHAHYGKHDFQKVEYPILTCNITAASNYNYTIKKADFNNDLHIMQNLYEKTASRFSCVLDRFEDSYWRKWVTEELKEAYLVYDGPTPIAYYTPEIFNENKVIAFKEFVCLPKIFDDVFLKTSAYLAYLNEFDTAEVAHVPSIGKLSDLSVKQELASGMMIKLITPFDIEGNNIKTTNELITVMKKSTYPIWFYHTDGF
ncbi:MAG: hypothetical protein K0S55_1149 [Clostridia bacterium]|nr:hypothetical protein [Clostridia bacterium]